MSKTRFLDRFFIFEQIHRFWPKWPILADFRAEKIENHHLGDCRHIDMFSRTECDPEIDSARLGDLKRPLKRSNWSEKLPFQR